jgi:hypothetical protein
VSRWRRAVAGLAARDRLRLRCYYAQQLTLKETGRLLGEHEATCSRQTGTHPQNYQDVIERQLRVEHGLSDEQVTQCFASVSQDSGALDLQQMLDSAGRKESVSDRSS